MDYFEAQDLFKQMYPEKLISFEFDEKCIRVYEIIFTDGIANPIHHIENNKLKVSIDGMNPIYVSIDAHREICTIDDIKKILLSN